MRVKFVTSNDGKIESANRHLQAMGISVFPVKGVDLLEPRSQSVGYIAEMKAMYAAGTVVPPLITSDAGFYIECLGGFPGPYVSTVIDNEGMGIGSLLKLADENESRECYFIEAVGYFDHGMESPISFETKIEGKLAAAPDGKREDWHWSDLARIFMPLGLGKTLASLTREEYISWSGNMNDKNSSFMKFGEWYRER